MALDIAKPQQSDRDSIDPKPEQQHVEGASHEDLTGLEDPDRRGVGHGASRPELRGEDAYSHLGYAYPTWKKWFILSVMFVIQISINLNASLYANAVDAISDKFHVSQQAARVPQLTFLCAYALGCELWAPWSEELGRWPTQQLSLLLVNIWQFPCAYAPNYAVWPSRTTFPLLQRREIRTAWLTLQERPWSSVACWAGCLPPVAASRSVFSRTCGSPMIRNTPSPSWCSAPSVVPSSAPSWAASWRTGSP